MFLAFFWLFILTVACGIALRDLDREIQDLKEEIEKLKNEEE